MRQALLQTQQLPCTIVLIEVLGHAGSCQLCVKLIVVCDLEQRQHQKGGKERSGE